MGTEIQDFAALLRGLKERSGLSYGTLAQKLHMSTSTVHRYCNGDAVPHDYAPVERFARVCRASADELVALHRKWILADEAKRRKVPGPAAAPAEPAPAPDPRPVRDPGPDAVSEPVPEPMRQAEAEPGVETRTEPGAEARTEPGAEARTEPAPVPEATSVTEPAPASARRRRPLRVALAAAAVVALAVPTTVMIGNMSSSQGSDTVTAGKAGKPEETGADASRPASGKAKPSGTATGGKASGSTSPSATGASPSAKQEPSRTVSPGVAGGTAPKTGVPLSVNVRPETWEDKCDQTYMLDRKPEKVPPPPYEADARGWASSLGAVPAGMKRIDLVVQGKEADAVVLEAMHVRVVGRTSPPAWQAYAMLQGCGSGVLVSTYEINLDAARPLFKAVPSENMDRTLPANPLPLKTSVNDPVVLVVYARTQTYDVRWYLELDWSSGDRHGTMRVDDDGKPFRTMSMNGRPLYDYWPEKKTWVLRDY
ncbi:helix-turn-helix domain-containing protein [Streptomyces sp. B1I3]|uniref:helix-turn-helix domain-containing protein n=1 Tax=Streptomyces sp. B1I3 TaxID=3042264 RepID=UPI0027812DD3|nr:helix-turn-helix domain-containing protein [Streptomyces sp. B1I3]MDQ0795754.1 transcriptional regulator with XRE-family HTH domain [Streptomyces sp. B1I3]